MGVGINGNLIPPKAGEIRNPKGKAKGTIHIKTLAKRIFDEMDTWERLPNNLQKIKGQIGDDKTYGEALIYAWLARAFSDPRFAAIILELMDGKGKLELDPLDSLFSQNKLTIEVVDRRSEIEEAEELEYNPEDGNNKSNPD